jgi:hypothetical protein
MQSQRAEVDALKKQTAEIAEFLEYLLLKERIRLHIGNLLVKFVDEIYRRKNVALPDSIDDDDERSLRRYTEAAALIGEENWKRDTDGLSSKYCKSLKNFHPVRDLPP